MSQQVLSCFKAYDIRGRLGDELNEDIAYRTGRAFAAFIKPQTVVVGGDARESSVALKLAVAKGLMDAGCNVIDLGMVGTEEIYFATRHLGIDGGIIVTGSHNPINENGMKLVRQDSKPISADSGLNDIKQLAEQNNFAPIESARKGHILKANTLPHYIEHLLTYLDCSRLRPLKLVVNAGNGAAGHVIDALETCFSTSNIPVTFIKVHHLPDSTFPNGIPNPLLVENRAATADAVRLHQADMGIAWDGDFDRCFLFDENGNFIEGYYIVGLLAQVFLQQTPGVKIIHDPRLTFNTIDIVQQMGGQAIQSKTGHAFIKERMRKEDAVYGGEMSAHHYFKDFGYCDSGMIPWLLIIALLSEKQQPLSQMVVHRIAKYPSAGEINRKIANPEKAIAVILARFQDEAQDVDNTDGISLEFEDWRFNLRQSNTESLLRLNVESRADEALMMRQTKALLSIIDNC
jgi:phosphomannomutase